MIRARGASLAIMREDPESIRLALSESPSNSVRILFAGELRGVDFDLFDFVIGWEPLEMGPRFVRMHPALREHRTLAMKLPNFSPMQMGEREFCNFIYSNPLAHPFRDSLFFAVSNSRKVDSLGPHLRNTLNRAPGQVGNWELEKIRMQARYRLSFAVENGLYPGYTTEKVFTALRAGSIPIYWGNPNVELDVNPLAILNLHLFNGVEEAAVKVLELGSDLERLTEMAAEPIFTPEQLTRIRESEDSLRRMLRHASEMAQNGGLYRPVGTSPNLREAAYYKFLRRSRGRDSLTRFVRAAHAKWNAKN